MIPAAGKKYPDFSPNTLHGCSLWLDASQISGTVNGGTLTSWNDLSPDKRAGTAVSGPIYNTNSLNGLPGVTFNGTSQYINFGNVLNLGTNPIHIFTVCRFSTTGAGTIIGKTSSRALSGRWALSRQASSIQMLIDSSATAFTASFANTSTDAQLLTGFWNRSNIFTFLNGTQQATTVLSSATSFSTTDPLWVGAYPNATGTTPPSSGLYFSGTIHEIIVYSDILTTQQRQQIEGYLAWKWGLNQNLVFHPFRLNPPLIRDFQPADIADLSLQFDASIATSFTYSSGINISSWIDQISGIAMTVYGNPPTRVDDSVLFVNPSNNHTTPTPQVLRNETPAQLTIIPNMSQSTGATMIVAHKTNLVNDYRNAFSVGTSFSINPTFIMTTGCGNNPSSGKMVGIYNPSTGQWLYLRTRTNAMVGNRIDTSVLTTIFASYTNGTLGTTLADNIGADGTIVSGSGVVTGIAIGGTPTFQGHNCYSGNIYEILYYSRALSLPDIRRIEAYLARKWKYVSATLATTNPFHLYQSLPSTVIFSPLMLTGLELWLDGIDPYSSNTTRPLPGDTISSWHNKAIVGDFAQVGVGGTVPTYVDNGGISFSSGHYNTTYGASFPNETLFVVYNYNTTTGTDLTLVGQNADGGRYLSINPTNRTIQSRAYNGANGGTSLPNVTNVNTFGIACLITTVSSMQIWHNGLTSGTPLSPAITASRTSTIGVGINTGSGVNTSQYFSGIIYEVLGFSRVLTKFERQQVEGYLAWKWGGLYNSLSSTAPNNHPFKRFTP